MPRDIICLYGPLGSGKTTFVQGLAEGFGIKRLPTSPSFILIQQYKIKDKRSSLKKLYHVDLYRLHKKEEIKHLDLNSLFSEKTAVTVIEWADRARGLLPKKRIDIFFTYHDKTKRKLRLINKKGSFAKIELC